MVLGTWLYWRMVIRIPASILDIYRRLSLSQSPGYQTKYFEISVVWDSQSVTSFTFFMYVELQLARKQSRTVELRNVTDSTLFTHSKIVCDQCLFCTLLPQVYLWYTLINLTQFLQHIGYVCCLHQRTPLNRVQSLKLQMRRYVPMGFIRTHLIVLTISVITAGQLNVNSWLSMPLRFIGIEYDFMSKQWMNLIALNKGLIAQSKEVLTL